MTDAARIVITGATSGIGRELALQYAAEGVTLGLVGRRAPLLDAVAADCRGKGARVLTYARDVSDGPGMQALASDFLGAAGGADLVVANAGMVHLEDLATGDAAPLTRLFDVNVGGVLNTLLPFVPSMKAAGQGHLVAVASVAGTRPLAKLAAYSASKAAVRTLMDGFAYELNDWGIDVTTINPGFVVSEMTTGKSTPMPFLVETDDAARRIRKAIAKRRRVCTFPLGMRVAMGLVSVLPRFVLARSPRGSDRRAG